MDFESVRVVNMKTLVLLPAALSASLFCSCVLNFDTTLPGEQALEGDADVVGNGGVMADISTADDIFIISDGQNDTSVCNTGFSSGRFLLALILTPLDRQQLSPIMIELNVVGESDGQYTFVFQPIATDFILVDQQRQPREFSGRPGEEGYSPAPREAVGSPITLTDIVVDEAGAFTVTVFDFRIEGFANALTFRDMLADVTFSGSFQTSDIGCGDLTGTGKEPIPNLNLNTSVFGLIRVVDPESYTGPIVTSCASQSACDDID